MGNRWEDAEHLLTEAATDDLRDHGVVEPALVAFAGAALRFVAWLRPFPPGGYHDPLIELLALAGPLDCDRLMLSMSGRIWPLDAPPPVDADGDHRELAVIITAVDATGDVPREWTVLRSVTGSGAATTLGERWLPGPSTGWIAAALQATVADRDRLHAPWPAVVEQAARVCELGHALYLPPDVHTLMVAAASGDVADRGRH